MFQHLLVPVDDSELSIRNVGQAVKLRGRGGGAGLDPAAEQPLAVLGGVQFRDGQSAAFGNQGHAMQLVRHLEGEHLREYELAARLQQAWAGCHAGVSGNDPSLARLDDALAALAGHVWAHLRLEEETLLPLALEVLTPGDWREIAEVFEGNQDPGFGEWSEEDFRRHFTSAANTAKPPRALPGAAT